MGTFSFVLRSTFGVSSRQGEAHTAKGGLVVICSIRCRVDELYGQVLPLSGCARGVLAIAPGPAGVGQATRLTEASCAGDEGELRSE